LKMAAGNQYSPRIGDGFMRGPSQREWFALLALAVILPIAILAAVSFARDAVDLANPCYTWGAASGDSVVLPTRGPCTSSGGTSETIPQTLFGLTIIQGGILLGSVLGVLGVLRIRPTLLVVSSAILFVESIPLVLGGAFVLTMPPAAFFLWRASAAGAFRM
jgi:hypothetical protein